MKRRLFNLLAGVSLLMCVATAGLWVRTYWRADQFYFSGGRYIVFTGLHQIYLGSADRPVWARPSNASFESFYESGPAMSYARSFGPFLGLTKRATNDGTGYAAFGFVYSSFFQPRANSRLTHVAVPYWSLFGLSAVTPLFWIRNRKNRRIPGLCPTCGYDLRATPGRCPECGTVCQTSA